MFLIRGPWAIMAIAAILVPAVSSGCREANPAYVVVDAARGRRADVAPPDAGNAEANIVAEDASPFDLAAPDAEADRAASDMLRVDERAVDQKLGETGGDTADGQPRADARNPEAMEEGPDAADDSIDTEEDAPGPPSPDGMADLWVEEDVAGAPEADGGES